LVTLEAIAKRHIEWIKIAKYIGASKDEADEHGTINVFEVGGNPIGGGKFL